ncbi:hypothetical protein NUITMVR1_42040 [Raoultella ornithinolytica]|nr:hypothetical protein NUITMVR1_42040 [Raoultella ornithinolytica]
MNSSLAAVTDTDYPHFGQPNTARQRKVLSVRNLNKSYSAQQPVLDNISFDLHAGELVGVIGRSGAGKSTLLHVLNGTHSATGGEILSYPEVGMPHDVAKLKGRALNAWRSECGMIFQDFCLVPRLDVLTNVLLGRLSGLAPIFPYTFYHLTHYWFAAADIPVANDTPVHYADAIRCNVRRPPQGSLPLLTRRVSA